MSRASVLALLLVLSAGGSRDAAAQGSADLRRTVRKLEIMHAAAVRARERAESLQRARFDTLRAGPVTALVHPKSWAAARDALDSLVPLIQSTYGGVAAHERPVVTLPDSTLDAVRARQSISHQVQGRLRPPAGHPWYRWSGNTFIAPFSPHDLDYQLGRTFVALVTRESPALTACFTGDIHQCRVALELAPAADRATEWYTAAHRRFLARWAMGDDSRARSSPLVNRCARGSDDACLEALRSGEISMQPPLGTSDRVGLACFLIATGDPATYGRLTAPARGIGEALERAGGVPLDSVVARWRAAVIAARPAPVTTPPGTAWAAVFWTVVLGALSLRSSRWPRI
jgi:hypothetical protein